MSYLIREDPIIIHHLKMLWITLYPLDENGAPPPPHPTPHFPLDQKVNCIELLTTFGAFNS